jgi:hypothetical protein
MQKSKGRIPEGRKKGESRNPKTRRRALIRVAEESPRDLQGQLLAQIVEGAGLCVEVERALGQNPSPQVATLIKLYRVLVLKICVEAAGAPTLLKLANDLMRPVMEWARLEEKRKERELAEQKYRDQLEKAAREKTHDETAEALTPETLAKIERELSLL